MKTSPRVAVLMLIALVLLALSVAQQDHAKDIAAPIVSGGGELRTELAPVAAPPGALSSTFYCAGASATAGDALDGSVVIANPTGVELTAQITVYPAALAGDQQGTQAVAALKPVTKGIVVGARARGELRLGDVQQSPFAAALVEVSGGDVAVERRTSGPLGLSASPCAPAPASTWYLPSGVTTRDGRELLALFNPFVDIAVLDISFITSDGFRSPPDLQGFVVEGSRLSVIDVGAAAGRHEQVSTIVRARSGRLVVDRLQTFDGTDPGHPAGAAATLAAPRPAPVWAFADGLVGEGLAEVFTILNPSQDAAEVQLEVALDNPDVNGVVDPIIVTVPPRGYAQVAMKDQTRVPAGVGHSVTVRGTNNVPVIAERVLSAVSPSPRRGYGPSLGSPVVASRWVFADGRADGTLAEWLVLTNPSADRRVRVKVTALAQGQPLAIDGLQSLEVGAGGRLAVDLGQHINRVDLALLVEADGAVVAERGLFAVSGPGLSLSRGMPLMDGLSLPPEVATTTTITTVPIAISDASTG
jgi:hypothetical protein